MLVRVSIENIAYMIDDDGFDLHVGLLPKELPKGIQKARPFGGAAILTTEGKRFLEDTFGALEFEPNAETGLYNARFKIDSEHLSAVSQLFSNLDACVQYEQDRTTVFMEEIEQYGIVIPAELKSITPQFVKMWSPKLAEPGAYTSGQIYRLSRVFRLSMGSLLIDKFMKSPCVVSISSRELEATNGGTPE